MRKSSKAILFALLLVGVLGAAFFTAKGDEASGATPVAQADQPRGAAPAANGDQSAGSTPGEDADQSTGSEADKYWSTECTGSSRALDKLVCSATQSILLAQSKELLFRIKVVVAAGSSAPVMEIQGPLNVYLPAGFSLSVDGAPLTNVSVSNCNRRGCFGGAPVERRNARVLETRRFPEDRFFARTGPGKNCGNAPRRIHQSDAIHSVTASMCGHSAS